MALTGDGADEIFGGYNRHVLGPRLWRRLAPLPMALRRPLGRALAGLEGQGARHAMLHRLAARAGLPVTLLDKMGRLGGIVAGADGPAALYARLTRGLMDPGTILATPPGCPSPTRRCPPRWRGSTGPSG